MSAMQNVIRCVVEEQDHGLLEILNPFWDNLRDMGLDVNGIYNDGTNNILKFNVSRPSYIRLALALQADPFIRASDDGLTAREYIEDCLNHQTITFSNVRERMQESACILEEHEKLKRSQP